MAAMIRLSPVFRRTLKAYLLFTMPRSKRSKLGESILNEYYILLKTTRNSVSLTKVSKKTKEHKSAMMTEVGYFFLSRIPIHLSFASFSYKPTPRNGGIAGFLKLDLCGMLISKLSEICGKSM